MGKKIKWQWIAGGGFALLFVFLLTIRLHVPDAKDIAPSSHAASPAKPGRSEDYWMSIKQAGRKIGFAHRILKTTETGYRLEENTMLRIAMMGVVQDIRMKTLSNLLPDMTLNDFEFDLQSNLFRFSMNGIIRGKEAVINYGTTTTPRKIVLPLPEAPHLSGGMYESLRGRDFKSGDQIIIHVFDPVSLGQRPVRLRMLGETSVLVMNQDRKARKFEVDFMGARQYAWLGEGGEVLREEGLLGMTLERTGKEEALEGLSASAGADLAEVASIPSNLAIDDPESLNKIVIRLAMDQKQMLNLDGGRQRLEKDILTIKKETIPSDEGFRPHPPEVKEFLKPSPLVQSDAPLIRRQVKAIVLPKDSDLTKAKKIVDWMYRRIEKRPVLSVPNALETLEKGRGDCNEHAVLLAAMARSAGIPAQIEAGLVYQRGRFYYHAWNVLYIGGWITADAALGQMPADVTHIRLVRGGTESHIDLMGVIGNLKLEIMETAK